MPSLIQKVDGENLFLKRSLPGGDKTSLEITGLKDKSLADLDNLPDPDVLGEEIIENLEAGLASFPLVLKGLNKR